MAGKRIRFVRCGAGVSKSHLAVRRGVIHH
jgi:hypothetical protein